jgi:hypothetical protein
VEVRKDPVKKPSNLKPEEQNRMDFRDTQMKGGGGLLWVISSTLGEPIGRESKQMIPQKTLGSATLGNTTLSKKLVKDRTYFIEVLN